LSSGIEPVEIPRIEPVEIISVDWFDPRAFALRTAMEEETSAMYAQFVAGLPPEVQAGIDAALAVDPDTIDTTLIALDAGRPAGHAALRPCGASLEVKKVFVPPAVRGRGLARQLMLELEGIARARAVPSLVLQTGVLQVPAIRLYEDLGYIPIRAFGAYDAIPNALCFEKAL
jgi:GNAT superfamily N-acetyltransferase